MVTVGRLITAMVTPFDGQGEVDYAQARHLASSLLDSGSDGLVVSGTTGESPTLNIEEKLRLFREIKAELGDRGAVVAGTGNYSTAESIDLTREAEKEGVDAALLVVPYYNKPTQEGLYQHFKAIAESTGLPCILYNVPSRTITSLSWETALRLSQVDNIIGVKEASGDFDQIARIISGARQGFQVWSGNDSDTFGIMTMGGYGVVSVASHLVGRQIKGMMDLVLAGKTSEAAEEHLRLTPIFKGLFIVSNPIPVKYGLNRAGFQVGKPRLPLTEPDERTAEQIQAMMREYRVDLAVAARVPVAARVEVLAESVQIHQERNKKLGEEVTRVSTVAGVHTVKAACDLFIQKVQEIGIVREIRLVEDGEEGPTIWTIISAPPFDRDARDPVYDAQLEVMRASKGPLVDFYVINLEELPPGRTAKILPSKSKLLWKWQHAW